MRRHIPLLLLLLPACLPEPNAPTQEAPHKAPDLGQRADMSATLDHSIKGSDLNEVDLTQTDSGLDAKDDGAYSPNEPDMAPIGRPRPTTGRGYPWVADGTPDPGAPAQVECGGCTPGEQRCLSDIEREVCEDDGAGCVQWRPAQACDAASFCQRDGSCADTNPCGRLNEVEPCDKRGAIRDCVMVEGTLTPSEARACDLNAPPPHCDTKAELGVISYGVVRAGSCVQVSNTYGTTTSDGKLIGVEPYASCGPCSWHQCVVGADGIARFECRAAFNGEPINWRSIPKESSPPTNHYGYTCSALQGKPIQGTAKIKRGGSHPWMVASHYQGAGCPKPNNWN